MIKHYKKDHTVLLACGRKDIHKKAIHMTIATSSPLRKASSPEIPEFQELAFSYLGQTLHARESFQDTIPPHDTSTYRFLSNDARARD